MVKTAQRLILYWHTVRYMKPVQWRYRVKNIIKARYRRWFPGRARRRLLRHMPPSISWGRADKNIEWFRKEHDGSHGMFRAEDVVRGRFAFLNCTKDFHGPVHWENPEFSYLWDFNLHYFEYLEPLIRLDDAESYAAIRALLEGWIDKNPYPRQPAWHPYPVSLRTINWIKLLVNHPRFGCEKVLRSLYSQILFLEKNLEKHLLANHLLENGRALLFGGLFFEGQDACRWLEMGLRILKDEVQEEYLPHGGHFERSPMYHCILLEGLLDAQAYLAATGHETQWIIQPLLKMCEWLENITCPDGSFPLFNDTAIGISAMPDEILANADRMIGFRRRQLLDSVRDCDGFFVLDAAPFFCVVDGAPIGPQYNPGHSHSDNFTYELFFEGARFVVDTGTYSYEVTPDRVASRATAAHNTVVVNDLEQSEVWGGFRVARRSNPAFSWAGRRGDCLVFRGKYLNRVEPRQGISHERIIIIKPSHWMLVWDSIEARGAIRAESRCHFAPGWQLSTLEGQFRITHSFSGDVYCCPIQVGDTRQTTGLFAHEFGKCKEMSKLIFLAQAWQHLEMGYLFTAEQYSIESQATVKCSQDRLIVQIGGQTTEVCLMEFS